MNNNIGFTSTKCILLFAFLITIVCGQKYRQELQAEGIVPLRPDQTTCDQAFKKNPSHTLCWKDDTASLLTGTSGDHDQWCTKQIRKFHSSQNAVGKYKMSDCNKLKIDADHVNNRYKFMQKLYMEEAGVLKDQKGKNWVEKQLDTAHSFLLWGSRKVVQGMTFGKVKRPDLPPPEVVWDARDSVTNLCHAAKKKKCADGNIKALQSVMKKFERALDKVNNAKKEIKKLYDGYDSSTSFTINTLKVTKFAGYVAAVSLAGPLIAKAGAAGATTALGSKGSIVLAGAGVNTVVTGSHAAATEYGKVQAGLQDDISWTKVVKEAGVAGVLHAGAGAVWLTKGGKFVTDKITKKLVSRLTSGKLLKMIKKVPQSNKLLKKAVESLGNHAAKLKNVDEEKIAALVFKSLITANKVVIKSVIKGYDYFKNKPEKCKTKNCFVKYVEKDLEKHILTAKGEGVEKLRAELTKIINKQYKKLEVREIKEEEHGNLRDNNKNAMKKKSPWSAKQVKKCTNKGGMCLNKKIDKCNDGTFKSNLCPGDWRWKCCIP